MHRRGKPYHRVNPASTPDRNQRSTVPGTGTRTGTSTGIIDQRLIEGAGTPSFKNWVYGSDQEDGHKKLQLQIGVSSFPRCTDAGGERGMGQGQRGIHLESGYRQSLIYSDRTGAGGRAKGDGCEPEKDTGGTELDAFGESQYQIRRQG